MAKGIRLKDADTGTLYYPMTVSDLVIDHETGETVKHKLDNIFDSPTITTPTINGGRFDDSKIHTPQIFDGTAVRTNLHNCTICHTEITDSDIIGDQNLIEEAMIRRCRVQNCTISGENTIFKGSINADEATINGGTIKALITQSTIDNCNIENSYFHDGEIGDSVIKNVSLDGKICGGTIDNSTLQNISITDNEHQKIAYFSDDDGSERFILDYIKIIDSDIIGDTDINVSSVKVKNKDVALSDEIPTKTSQLTNDSGYISSANDILTKLKTVDGSGSGLDADLLDGKQPSELSVAVSDITNRLGYTYYDDTFDANTVLGNNGGKVYVGSGGSVWTNIPSTTGNAHAKTILNIPVSTSTAQLFFNSTGNVHYRVGNSNSTNKDWKEFAFTESSSTITASGFKVNGKTGFLKADGNVDDSNYQLSTEIIDLGTVTTEDLKNNIQLGDGTYQKFENAYNNNLNIIIRFKTGISEIKCIPQYIAYRTGGCMFEIYFNGAYYKYVFSSTNKLTYQAT